MALWEQSKEAFGWESIEPLRMAANGRELTDGEKLSKSWAGSPQSTLCGVRQDKLAKDRR